MAAVYTQFRLEEIEKYLKRGWRSMRPRQGVGKAEYFYDLSLSKDVSIRVWTSIRRGQEVVRGKHDRPMRVQLAAIERPGGPENWTLPSGKWPIVKRTQNWRTTLQKRIEAYMQEYYSKQDYWERRAVTLKSEPQKIDLGIAYASQPQINYIQGLRRRVDPDEWERVARKYDLSASPSDEELSTVLKEDASKIIAALKDMMGGRRWASGEEDPTYSYNRTGNEANRLREVEPGYWADTEVRWTIERAASAEGQERFRLADMQSAWRQEAGSLDEAVSALSAQAGVELSV